MGQRFYVTVDGDRFEGPFPDRKQAKRRAAELTTNEVYLTYAVEAVDEEE